MKNRTAFLILITFIALLLIPTTLAQTVENQTNKSTMESVLGITKTGMNIITGVRDWIADTFNLLPMYANLAIAAIVLVPLMIFLKALGGSLKIIFIILLIVLILGAVGLYVI